MKNINELLAVALLLAVLPLSGCFKSDTPLITVFDSVTPIPEGRYTYVDTDKSTNSVIITHDGTVTKMTSIKADGSAKIDKFLMQEIDKGYYILMDANNNYTLIRVNPKNVIEFNGSILGDKLLAVARSAGKNISDYGVVRVTGDQSHTCWFDDLDSLKGAMAALQNSGTELSNGTFLVNGLEIARIYNRQ